MKGFGRKQLYSLLVVGLILGGWANLRGVPQLLSARRSEKELASLDKPQAAGPSAAQLTAQLSRLREEQQRLEAMFEKGRGLGPELEVALTALSQRSGLSVERIATQAALRKTRGGAQRQVFDIPRAGGRGGFGGSSSRRGENARLAGSFLGGFRQVRAFVRELETLEVPAVAEVFSLELAEGLQPGEGPLRLQLEIVP